MNLFRIAKKDFNKSSFVFFILIARSQNEVQGMKQYWKNLERKNAHKEGNFSS
jgi:hypothetical protein